MRILVAEDAHKIASSIKKGLEQESYAVDVAYDGKSGFDLAVTEDYDVIILDLLLPEMDGLAVCSGLRKQGIYTPILILTAKGQVSDRVAGLDVGADDYLTKPFAFEELLARVRALTRRPHDTLKVELKKDNLTLNTITHSVERDQQRISLSVKEYSLLEYLLRHAGQTVSKEQIITHVWNYDADILPNTVEVYIGYLRNKVDKAFPDQSPLIQTVHGFGYRIGSKG